MATATIHDIRIARKPQGITHYAYYGDLYGTAELLNGSGYLFRRGRAQGHARQLQGP